MVLHLHETSPVVTVPLILLAIPSVIVGGMYAGPILVDGMLSDAIHVAEGHNTLAALQEKFGSATAFARSAASLLLDLHSLKFLLLLLLLSSCCRVVVPSFGGAAVLS